ncbi:MAG: biopolymer transporter ExbD [Akkermansiaceae bacterium]|nr:biopolymer transporter ExbD [Akkermansiaceae bacterium]MCF7730519.1 biopolymer transporter ExbD [Akkermansiaceae bacterium]
MARHKRYDAVEEEKTSLDISSLIDVTFLLLIYFLVTSAIQVKETDLGMKLPAAMPSDKQPDIEPMFIKIDASGIIYAGTGNSQMVLDSDPNIRSLPMLAQQLDMYASAARSANKSPLVQLWADGGATTQRVIDVINALAVVKIESVTFTDLVD